MNQRNNSVCEACRLSGVEVEIPSAQEDPVDPYRLCRACAKRLEELALRPSEWFNLAAIHGPWKTHLHDDFYDEDGKAYQPNSFVERAVEFPAPTVAEIEDNVERLVDMAMTRWFFSRERTPELIEALGRNDKLSLLNVLQSRVGKTPIPSIESRAYEVAGVVLQGVAADWIRYRAETHSAESFIAWSFAAASCLPFEESFARVTAKLATNPN